jgi:hypothetical protein
MGVQTIALDVLVNYIYILEQVHLLATKMDTLGVRVEPFRCSF